METAMKYQVCTKDRALRELFEKETGIAMAGFFEFHTRSYPLHEAQKIRDKAIKLNHQFKNLRIEYESRY
jgi:hypothetical protein